MSKYDLISEAKDYARKRSSGVYNEAHEVDFTAGANSKFARVESLRERINLCKGLKIMFSLKTDDEKELDSLIAKFEKEVADAN